MHLTKHERRKRKPALRKVLTHQGEVEGSRTPNEEATALSLRPPWCDGLSLLVLPVRQPSFLHETSGRSEVMNNALDHLVAETREPRDWS